MDFLSKLFSKGKQQEGKSADFIKVSNNEGIGDGTSLLVERHPNLERIFSDPNPHPPQQLTQENRSYWESKSP